MHQVRSIQRRAAAFCAEEARAHLQDAIKRHTGLDRTVAQWNDHPERTHAEIMQAFGWAIDDET